MTAPIGVSSEEFALIRSVLKQFFDGACAKFYFFGSRAAGTPRPESDLDILIEENSEIPLHTMVLLREAFEEKPLPFKVDAIDYHRISEDFRQKAMREGKQFSLED